MRQEYNHAHILENDDSSVHRTEGDRVHNLRQDP